LNTWRGRFNPAPQTIPLMEPYLSLAVGVGMALEEAIAVTRKEHATLGQLKDALEDVRSYLLMHRSWKAWEGLYDKYLGEDRLPLFYEFRTALQRFERSLPVIHEENGEAPAVLFRLYREKVEEMGQLCQAGIEAMRGTDGKADGKTADKIRRELKRKMREADIIRVFRQREDVKPEEQEVPNT